METAIYGMYWERGGTKNDMYPATPNAPYEIIITWSNMRSHPAMNATLSPIECFTKRYAPPLSGKAPTSSMYTAISRRKGTAEIMTTSGSAGPAYSAIMPRRKYTVLAMSLYPRANAPNEPISRLSSLLATKPKSA